MKLAIVSPFPPSVGGMSVLAQTLKQCLEKRNIEVIAINTHPEVTSLFSRNNFTIKAYQFFVFLLNIRRIVTTDLVLIISSSGIYFYVKALPVLLVGKILNRPVILYFVGGGAIDNLKKDNSYLAKCLKIFDCILVPTPTFEKAFSRAHIPYVLFPHIVQIEKFSSTKKPMTAPVLLAAKNLAEYSGIETLIRAYAEIKKTYPDAHLIIAGDGPKKATLQQMVHRLNLSNVEFLGSINHDRMPALFESATLFVHGTRYESFGIVLVEALASGTPIVSTNAGGIPDIIEDGINGYLFNYNDHISMAKSLKILIENKTIYRMFVDNGLISAKLYSGQNLTPKLIDILTRCSNKNK